MAKKSAQPQPVDVGAIEELTFEQAFAELAKIVDGLQDAKLSLEESLVLHARGRELADFCSAQLEQAELRIRKLSTDD
ncbi:MAG: exodeoxyribonuclease VII small subunit [Chloroflexi bacterium]|nr:exodeoxyribonuclease VII small subunit [Chloroflexota bacterium]